jgi:hypothetical protein
MKQKDNKPGITKVKWEKVDKEWYEVILRENISSIKHKLVTGDMPIGENILKICEIMKSAAITSSSNKAIFKAKPRLKVWTNEIKTQVHLGFRYLPLPCHGMASQSCLAG